METTKKETSFLAAVDQGDGGHGYRSVPHNLDIEQALLGAILVNNEAANKVNGFLLPEHFYEPLHGRIFEAILKLTERGQIVSPATLMPYFESDEAMRELGGGQYLATLASETPTIINAESYGRLIYDLYLRRELIGIGEDIVHRAYDASDVDRDASDQIEGAEQQLFNLAEQGQFEGGFQTFTSSIKNAVEAIEAAYKRDSLLTGVTTGIRRLDQALGGLHRSDLLILAGRPSMGKTALATNIAYNAAREWKKGMAEGLDPAACDGAIVGFFSLEMSAEQLATRLLAEASGIPSEKLRRGEINKDKWNDLVEASIEMQDLPLYIDDTPALTIAGLRTRARRLKRQHGLSLIVVDYLQLLRVSATSRADSRVQEISEITRGLKTLAKELDVPVLALSQLSRAVEQREPPRPTLADLRESGSIEQDADVVMFVYREEYYKRRKKPAEGTDQFDQWQEEMASLHNKAEIIVGKQRHGPTTEVELFFEPETTRFGDPERDEQIPDVIG